MVYSVEIRSYTNESGIVIRSKIFQELGTAKRFMKSYIQNVTNRNKKKLEWNVRELNVANITDSADKFLLGYENQQYGLGIYLIERNVNV